MIGSRAATTFGNFQARRLPLRSTSRSMPASNSVKISGTAMITPIWWRWNAAMMALDRRLVAK